MNIMDEKKQRMIEKEEEITNGSGIWSGYLIGNDPDNEYSVKYLRRAAEKICSNRIKWSDIIVLYSDSTFGEGKSGFALSTDGICRFVLHSRKLISRLLVVQIRREKRIRRSSLLG